MKSCLIFFFKGARVDAESLSPEEVAEEVKEEEEKEHEPPSEHSLENYE